MASVKEKDVFFFIIFILNTILAKFIEFSVCFWKGDNFLSFFFLAVLVCLVLFFFW